MSHAPSVSPTGTPPRSHRALLLVWKCPQLPRGPHQSIIHDPETNPRVIPYPVGSAVPLGRCPSEALPAPSPRVAQVQAAGLSVQLVCAQMSEADSAASISVQLLYWGVSSGNPDGGVGRRDREGKAVLCETLKSRSRERPLWVTGAHAPGTLVAHGEQSVGLEFSRARSGRQGFPRCRDAPRNGQSGLCWPERSRR